MECCYGVLIILGLIFLYRLYGAIFLERLEDKDLVDLVGFEWKNIPTIQKEAIDIFSNSWGGPRPYPSIDTLTVRLSNLERQGFLTSREVPVKDGSGKPTTELEYKRTGKRFPVKKKRAYSFIPQWGFEGISRCLFILAFTILS